MFKTPQELQSLLYLVKGARHVSRALSWIGLVGKDTPTLDAIIEQGDALMDVTEFNASFAQRGWVLNNMISVPAARAALAAARAGDWQRADEILADAYSPSMVRLYINHMGNLRCFRDRVDLAKLACDDYESGRYHACVPVTLALLDGMGQQLVGASFFRQGAKTDKVAGSFLEIGPGFAQLLKLFGAPRRRTIVAQIDVPYRHGIMHGTDLGYATRIVAAKAWGALFTAGSYAKDVENPAKKEVRPGLLESLRNYAASSKRNDAAQREIEAWRPRSTEELSKIVANQEILEGTPEHAVASLVDYWRAGNFGRMANMSVDGRNDGVGRLAGQARKNLGPAPSRFRITEIEDEAPAAGWVSADLGWGEGPSENVRLRVLYMAGGDIAVRGATGGEWLVYSLWPLESVRWRDALPEDSENEDEPEGS